MITKIKKNNTLLIVALNLKSFFDFNQQRNDTIEPCCLVEGLNLSSLSCL